jgi:hypothetical protein
MDRNKHAKTDTSQSKEQANSNNDNTFGEQPINNKSEEEMVCIY